MLIHLDYIKEVKESRENPSCSILIANIIAVRHNLNIVEIGITKIDCHQTLKLFSSLQLYYLLLFGV